MTTVSGWGNNTPVTTGLRTPRSAAEIGIAIPPDAPVIARGLGRSYGDAAQLAGGMTLDMTALDRILSVDESTGIARVEAGVTIEQLIRELVPKGWFVPVVPGTKWVTIGGAIAADVHGKNHHMDGSFGSHLRSITLIDSAGEVHRVTPSDGAEQFWATVGGMGLTGIIVEAEVALRRVPSAAMWANKRRITNLDALMSTMVEIDGEARYSVAWVDAIASGSGLGRGVLAYGDHADPERFASGADPFAYSKDKIVEVPRLLPNGLVNRVTVRGFSEAWYRTAPARGRWSLTPIPAFFHPLDRIQMWNRIYGTRGFVQYQFAVPDSGAHLIQTALERLQRVGGASFLTVLKRFGGGNAAPLSFPTKGWTLALDVPADVCGLGNALDSLDSEVASAGGRVYLAKDSRVRPEILETMYPRLSEWQDAREAMHARGHFESDLSRRLNL